MTGNITDLFLWRLISSHHEGVVVHRDGRTLQRTFEFRCPDLDTFDALHINDISAQFSEFVRRLGENWALQLEVQRSCTQDYPSGAFDRLAPYLIDKERYASFRRFGKHFSSDYYLTFTHQPASAFQQNLGRMFMRDSAGDADISAGAVRAFVDESDSAVGILKNYLAIEPLNNQDTVAFLHSTISLERHPIEFPDNSVFLHKILPDTALETDLTMKLGDYFIPIVGVNDFPKETYPEILDALNRAALEYRWVTRYICFGKEEGRKAAEKKRKAHSGNQTTWLQSIASSITGEPPRHINKGALEKAEDADEAFTEIERDEVSLGHYISNVMVWDTSLKEAEKKAAYIKQIINEKGFTCKNERYSALEAWKSMLPGEVYSNYRQYFVTSSTLSHIIPLSSVWAGMEKNRHAGEITGMDMPHVACSTADGTPFFLNINPSDVGHTAIWGPTGAGKSTLLNLLEMQFFKYPGSQVIVFDKGRSCRQPVMAFGGLFYEPAGEGRGAVNFQPLRELESERDALNAQELIEIMLEQQFVKITPAVSGAITEGIGLMRDMPPESRTLTSFVQLTANFQDPAEKRQVIKEGLAPYCLGGKYGGIFDNSASAIDIDSRYIAFEMENLMNTGVSAVVPALTHLFNVVEKKFDRRRLTMLVLDEAWLFLKNERFAGKIAEWLKVLRKLNVFVVFATQDVADVIHSPLFTTVSQQCLTKIYLADPQAGTPGMYGAYAALGLTDTEIGCISRAVMKKDYFYTSPLGRRLFQLDLGKITLGIIGGADHGQLDLLQEEHPEAGYEFCRGILDAKHIDYSMFLEKMEKEKAE